MQSIVMNMAALSVAMLYYLWRAHYLTRQLRQRQLCERVAFMLWLAADQITGRDSGLSRRIAVDGR